MAIFNSYVSLPEGIYYTQYIPICTQYINGCIPEMTWNDQALIKIVHPPTPLAGASHVPPVEDTMPWKPGHRLVCQNSPHQFTWVIPMMFFSQNEVSSIYDGVWVWSCWKGVWSLSSYSSYKNGSLVSWQNLLRGGVELRAALYYSHMAMDQYLWK